MAEKQSIKRFIVRDPHGHIEQEDSFSVVGEVHVDIVPGYGEPYAESEYVNGTLTITIHNIEGNGITEITTNSQEGDEAVNTVTIKTNANPEGVTLEVRNGSRGNGIVSTSEVLSPEDGGTNTHTFIDTDGNEHVFHTKNGQTGRKGDQGDSAVYDPSSPDAPDFVMANTTGQSTTKAMTQKAVTDEVTINKKISNLWWTTGKSISPETGGVSTNAFYDVSSYINIEGCKMLYVPVSKVSNTVGYAFYDSSKNYINNSGGTYQGTTEASSEYQYYLLTPPNNAKYIRFTANSRNKSYWNGTYPTLYDVSQIKENIANVDEREELLLNFTNGYGIKADDGTTSASSPLASSQYVDITKYDELIVPQIKTSFAMGVALYDNNKTYIEGISYQKDNISSGEYEYVRIRTNGAAFVRVTGFSYSVSFYNGKPSLYGVCHNSHPLELADMPINFALVNGWWQSATLRIVDDTAYVASCKLIYADCDLEIDCNDGLEMCAFYKDGNVLRNIDINGNGTNTAQSYRRNWVIKGGNLFCFQIRKTPSAEITPEEVYGKFHIKKHIGKAIDALEPKESVIANPYWEAPNLDKDVIFSTSVDGAGGALRRIPTVVIANSGTILAATEVRSTLADNAQTGIVLARKESGGSWTYNNVLPYSQDSYGKVMNPSFAVVKSGSHAGRIYLFFVAFPITQSNDGYAYLASTEEMDNKYIYSDDDGVNWTSPASTKSAWDTDEWTWVGASPANGVDVGEGKPAFPTMGRDDSQWYSGVMTFDTADGSATYSKRSLAASDNESTLFVASNGVVYLNARNENDSHKRNLYAYSISSNTLEPVLYDEDPNCKCQQSICKCGDIYLRSACNPSSTETRDNLTIYVSKDGLTWCQSLLINTPTTYGYSVVDANNDKCVLVYENTGTISFVDLSEFISQFATSSSTIGKSVEWRLQKLIEVIKS